jgi:hypothetical protein
MDLLMEKWQLRALDLNRRMSGLNTLSPRQMMMAATLRQKAVTAFDARLGSSPIPASFTARQMAARSAVAPTIRPLSGSPRDLLQKKLKAMHTHTEQLAEDLQQTRRQFDRRTATRSQHPQLAPKPKLLKPTTSRDKEDA